MAFEYEINGKKYTKSSDIPTIVVGGKEIPRGEFRRQIIDAHVAQLPAMSGQQVYIATGGGYGSNEKLVGWQKEQGTLANNFPFIAGEPFRTNPAFLAEKSAIEAQIRAQNPTMSDADVVRTYRAFMSDEVNTQIGKEIVNAGITAGKAVGYESASLYPDTLERVRAAKAAGMTTHLIAGDMDFREALNNPRTNQFNTVTSYQRFSARWDKELVPVFDKIELYNTDGVKDGKPPVLIAEKKGTGKPLVVYDQTLYAQFKAKACLDPNQFRTAATAADITAQNHINGLFTNPGAAVDANGVCVAPDVRPPAERKI